jgi:hypothetical protein
VRHQLELTVGPAYELVCPAGGGHLVDGDGHGPRLQGSWLVVEARTLEVVALASRNRITVREDLARAMEEISGSQLGGLCCG